MLYARVYRTIPGVATHKASRWGKGSIAKVKSKNEEPVGVTIVHFRNLNIWAAVGKWKFIHAKKFVLIEINNAEFDTDIAFGLWPELTLIRYPNWVWRLKKLDWVVVCINGLSFLTLLSVLGIISFVIVEFLYRL
jgi:hypothetical protein